VAAAALLAAAPAGAATSATDAVNFLNQQRTANSIPAGIPQDAYRTKGCENHIGYMHQNGLGHGEDPSKPGFTPEGADMSSGEVLTQGIVGWTADSNPWDAAPLHQTLLFDPRVNAAGYSEDDTFACMRFGFNFTSSPQPLFYAYTGDTGRSGVPFRVVVNGEGPYAPQEAVGIAQGVPTGPNILFFTDGFGSTNHAILYNLIGPGNHAVDVKLVDSTTPPPGGNSYKPFNRGGDMIPVKPLDPLTTYTANVIWHNDDSGEEKPQSVTFKTSGQLRGLTLSLSKKLSKSGRKATLKAPVEAVGEHASVRIQLAKKGKSLKIVSTKTVTLKRSQTIKVPKPSKGGKAVVHVTLPSFVQGDTRYDTPPVSRTYH
jgi:hypothetical protein